MTSRMNASAVGAVMRDLYPAPGTRIKQWVIEARRESAWERETCPRVNVPPHIDNCMPEGWDPALDAEYGPPLGGRAECRNVGTVPWTFLNHDSCYFCGELQDATRDRPDVATWLELKAQRPPITADREALSDEIAPDFTLAGNPAWLALTRRR